MTHPQNAYKPLPSFLYSSVRYFALAISKVVWRIRFTNRELIPSEDGRGLLIASNHQTYLDPFWIGVPVYRKLRFMAWDEAFGWFLIGRIIRSLGAFPVSIDRRGAVGPTKESLRILKEGATLVVFPEGSRGSPEGKMLPFRPGAARLAIEAGVPILPVTVRGGNRIWPQGRLLPRPGRVEVIYHAPIECPSYEGAETTRDMTEKIMRELEQVISSAL